MPPWLCASRTACSMPTARTSSLLWLKIRPRRLRKHETRLEGYIQGAINGARLIYNDISCIL